ncbi:MAG: hypothetical protein KAR35_11680, partial [Candidatus Heimdallarchaeota archaeon]|nr:hypothetical protein [Candidatus Heimdallarchaeota archaeon]MCK5050022.1 hypothetical protein [Candidatus Heimdallarchaeota archaeon]
LKNTGILSLEALEDQDFNLSLGMMAGSVIAFLGMIWWMMIQLGDDQDLKLGDTGFGFWFHLLFALGLMALSHTIYTIERDSA